MGLIFFFYCFVFLFGLAVGSFLNCIIYRLQTKESFLKGRSHCPYCKHILSWQDLIPVLSFLILRGKCRYCKKQISWQYPLVELATGILFVLITSATPDVAFLTTYYLLLTSFLIIIFVYDLKYYIIPDKVIYPAIAITFLYNLFIHFNPQILSTKFYLLNTLLAALIGSFFFLFIFLLSRGKWIGFGDVKLAFFMGLFLNFPNILVALFFAFLIGAIIGIGLVLASKKKLRSEVPFGPFLVAGTFIALFGGEKIINWYLNLFLL